MTAKIAASPSGSFTEPGPSAYYRPNPAIGDNLPKRTVTICSMRLDPQCKSGSATGPTMPRGLRSREAVKVRRSEAILADAGPEESTREGNFHQRLVRLTACRAVDIVAGGGKVV